MAITRINTGTAGMGELTQAVNVSVDKGYSKSTSTMLLEAFGQVVPGLEQAVQAKSNLDNQKAFAAGTAEGVKRIASGDLSQVQAPAEDAPLPEQYQYAGTLQVWGQAKKQQLLTDLDIKAAAITSDPEKIRSGKAVEEINQLYDTHLKDVASSMPELVQGIVPGMYSAKMSAINKVQSEQAKYLKEKATTDAKVGLIGMLGDAKSGGVAAAYNSFKTSVIAEKSVELILDQAISDAREGDFKTLNDFEQMSDADLGLTGEQLAVLHGVGSKLNEARSIRSNFNKDLVDAALKEEQAQQEATEQAYRTQLEQDRVTGKVLEPGYGVAAAKAILNDRSLGVKNQNALLAMLPAAVKDNMTKAMSGKLMQDPVALNNAIASNQISAEEATKGGDAYVKALFEAAANEPDKNVRAAMTAVEIDRLSKVNAKISVIDNAIKAFTTGKLYDEKGARIGDETSEMVLRNLLNSADFASLRGTYGYGMQELGILQQTQSALRSGAAFNQAVAGASSLFRSPVAMERKQEFDRTWKKDGMAALMADSSYMPGVNDSLFGVNSSNIAGNAISAGNIAGGTFFEGIDEAQARNLPAGIILKDYADAYAANTSLTNPAASAVQTAENFKKEIASSKFLVDNVFTFMPQKDLMTGKSLYLPKDLSSTSSQLALAKAVTNVAAAKAKKMGWDTKNMAIDMGDPDVVTIHYSGTNKVTLDRKMIMDYSADVVRKQSVDVGALQPAPEMGLLDVLGNTASAIVNGTSAVNKKTQQGVSDKLLAEAKAGLATAKGAKKLAYEGIIYQAKTDAQHAADDLAAFTKSAMSTQGSKSSVQVNREALDKVLGLQQKFTSAQEEAKAAASPVTGPIVASKDVTSAAREIARYNIGVAAVMTNEGFVPGGVPYMDGTSKGPKFPTYGFGFNTGFNNRKEATFKPILAAAGLPTDEKFMADMEAGKVKIDFDTSVKLLKAAVDVKYMPQARQAYGAEEFDKLPPNLQAAVLVATYNNGPAGTGTKHVIKSIKSGNVQNIIDAPAFAERTKGIMLKVAKGTAFFSNSVVAGKIDPTLEGKDTKLTAALAPSVTPDTNKKPAPKLDLVAKAKPLK